MPSHASPNRNALLAVLCLVVVLLLASFLVSPADAPAFARGLDAWVRAHWVLFVWVIVAIGIVDFVLFFDRLQADARQRLDALERRLTDLERKVGELNRKA